MESKAEAVVAAHRWPKRYMVVTPLAAISSFPLLIAARIALGLGEAATFPATYGMLGKWVPATERSRSIALLMSGIPIGTLFALVTTGLIVMRYGGVTNTFGTIPGSVGVALTGWPLQVAAS